jgi:hypothetical protein
MIPESNDQRIATSPLELGIQGDGEYLAFIKIMTAVQGGHINLVPWVRGFSPSRP